MSSQRPTGNDLRHRVGANLRAAQQAAGLKNRELADAAGVEIRDLSRHKSGEVMPRIDTLAAYAEKLDVSVASLFEEQAA